MRKLSIQSINDFLENRDQNSLDTSLSLQYFSLRLTIELIIIILELQIKATYRNFLTEQ